VLYLKKDKLKAEKRLDEIISGISSFLENPEE